MRPFDTLGVGIAPIDALAQRLWVGVPLFFVLWGFLLYLAVRKLSRGRPTVMIATLVPLVVCGVAVGAEAVMTHDTSRLFAVESIDQFAIGMMLAVAVEARWAIPRPALLGAIHLATAFPLAHEWPSMQRGDELYSILFQTVVAAGFALLLAATVSRRTMLDRAPVVALGTVS
jgi:peptidoglycan/LPS O-acetylase OafA/YrhL